MDANFGHAEAYSPSQNAVVPGGGGEGGGGGDGGGGGRGLGGTPVPSFVNCATGPQPSCKLSPKILSQSCIVPWYGYRLAGTLESDPVMSGPVLLHLVIAF